MTTELAEKLLLVEPLAVGVLFVLGLATGILQSAMLAVPTIILGIGLILWAVAPRPRFVSNN